MAYRFEFSHEVDADSLAEASAKVRALYMDKDSPVTFNVFKDGRPLMDVTIDPADDEALPEPVLRLSNGKFKPYLDAAADISVGVARCVCKFCGSEHLDLDHTLEDAHCTMCDCWQNGEYILSLTDAGRQKVLDFLDKYALPRVNREDYLRQVDEISEDLLYRPEIVMDLPLEETQFKSPAVLKLVMADFEAVDVHPDTHSHGK